MQKTDPRIEEAKLKPINEVADRMAIDGLKRAGRELVGPCPNCGGHDRFSINGDMGIFNCRSCGGGDVIRLVELVQGCDFKTALTWLCGDAPVNVDPAETERRRKRLEATKDKREREAQSYRQYARRRAFGIWQSGEAASGTDAESYLRMRGLPLAQMPPCIRFIADHPFVKKIAGQNRRLHSGPAMIAAIQAPDGRFSGVHQTWLDLSRFKGKALISGLDGKPMGAKLVLGSKRTGAIRLHTPEGAKTMVMGEGIETTATAWVSDAVPKAAYWAGVDLGNMAGRQVREKGKRHSGLPDLSAGSDGFVPPDWVQQLIYIMDGASHPKDTHAKLLAGCRRAMARVPGLASKIVPAEPGKDLNDMIMGEPENG